MDNNLHDGTARAGAAGGKLKLSEIIAALENESLEPDRKALLLIVDKDHTRGLFDHNLLDVSDEGDIQLLQLKSGLTALACQFMSMEPEAMAAVAAAYGRSQQKQRMADCLEELRGRLTECKAGHDDGKEAE